MSSFRVVRKFFFGKTVHLFEELAFIGISSNCQFCRGMERGGMEGGVVSWRSLLAFSFRYATLKVYFS